MDESELIHLFDKNRHDILNHIQLVHGYLSMNQPEKAKEKLDDWVYECNQGRSLSNLQIPKFALWTIRFDLLYTRLRLSYEIDSRINLSQRDMEIYRLSNEFADRLLKSGSSEILHEVALTVKNDDKNVYFEFRAGGPFEFADRFSSAPETEFQTEYKANKEEIWYRILIPYQS